MIATDRPVVGWVQSIESWRLAIASLQATPRLAGSALAAAVVTALVGAALSAVLFPLGALLGIAVQAIGSAAWSSSLAIAVHRFVLRQEARDRLVWEPPAEFAAYFQWLLLVQLAFAAGGVLATLLTPFGPALVGIAGLLNIAITIAACVYVFRILLLFPAIAVAAPDPTIAAAQAASAGHRWRMFLLLALTSLVGIVPLMVAFALLGAVGIGAAPWAGAGAGLGAALLAGCLSAVAAVASAAALTAMVSLCYRAYWPDHTADAATAPVRPGPWANSPGATATAAPVHAPAEAIDVDATVRIAPGGLRGP